MVSGNLSAPYTVKTFICAALGHMAICLILYSCRICLCAAPRRSAHSGRFSFEPRLGAQHLTMTMKKGNLPDIRFWTTSSASEPGRVPKGNDNSKWQST
eukprot:10631595-Karenia_brevis.AAC.1